jgi:UDP-N-acetylglucosamine--N-acetylmuramyl-(pentapeptide) pyrophosphoryl-undecaprenol N-acetylglucosamine transferase
VRQDLIDIESKRVAAIEYFNLDATKKTLLVLGGSLGARRVNQLIEKELKAFKTKCSGNMAMWEVIF